MKYVNRSRARCGRLSFCFLGTHFAHAGESQPWVVSNDIPGHATAAWVPEKVSVVKTPIPNKARCKTDTLAGCRFPLLTTSKNTMPQNARSNVVVSSGTRAGRRSARCRASSNERPSGKLWRQGCLACVPCLTDHGRYTKSSWQEENRKTSRFFCLSRPLPDLGIRQTEIRGTQRLLKRSIHDILDRPRHASLRNECACLSS